MAALQRRSGMRQGRSRRSLNHSASRSVSFKIAEKEMLKNIGSRSFVPHSSRPARRHLHDLLRRYRIYYHASDVVREMVALFLFFFLFLFPLAENEVRRALKQRMTEHKGHDTNFQQEKYITVGTSLFTRTSEINLQVSKGN
jgi:hypothetical protein